MNIQKTPSLKASEVNRDWYLVDASKIPAGRVSTVIANLLIGKHKSTYSPNIDNGDFVVVINTDNLKFSGNKGRQKVYYRHSGYIGGLSETELRDQMTIDSTQVIIKSVKGMLPKNKLQNERLKRLKVYSGSEHQHQAQKPKNVSLGEDK